MKKNLLVAELNTPKIRLTCSMILTFFFESCSASLKNWFVPFLSQF